MVCILLLQKKGEKPPGRDVDDIRRVIDIEKKNPGLLLKYGFNHRYHDSVRDAQRIIKSGELGEIINMRGVYGKSKVIPFSGGWPNVRLGEPGWMKSEARKGTPRESTSAFLIT